MEDDVTLASRLTGAANEFAVVRARFSRRPSLFDYLQVLYDRLEEITNIMRDEFDTNSRRNRCVCVVGVREPRTELCTAALLRYLFNARVFVVALSNWRWLHSTSMRPEDFVEAAKGRVCLDHFEVMLLTFFQPLNGGEGIFFQENVVAFFIHQMKAMHFSPTKSRRKQLSFQSQR